jgi:hypothetical protein
MSRLGLDIWLADDDWRLHFGLGLNKNWRLNEDSLNRFLHHNWMLDWLRKNRIRFDNLGLGMNLSDFDVKLEFAVTGESNCIGHLQIRIIFEDEAFVVGVKVDDYELADFGDCKFVDELSALVVKIFVRLDSWDSFEGGVVVDSEGQLDIQIDNLGLVHFWLIARGNKFLVNLKVINLKFRVPFIAARNERH